MTDQTAPINAEILNRLLLMIPGAKSMICRSPADYTPYIEPGQKHIDYISEPENLNFGLSADGVVMHMKNDHHFQYAVADQTPITLIFSVPKNSFGMDAVLRLVDEYIE